MLPAAGAVPFMIGAPHASFTDAYFEAMSGLTTTGTTAFVGLDHLPKGTNLWRAFLNWAGGLGINVVAMIFLPVMKVGGMQFFKSEGFDTLGKIMPRAGEIAAEMTREKLTLRLHEEIPYQLTVETEAWAEQPDGSARIDQLVYVTRPGHKGIVLGKGGETIKAR